MKTFLLFMLCYVIACIIDFPGVFGADVHDQYSQAKTGLYRLHHPPMMAYVWSLLLKIYDNMSVILFFHLAIFWVAIYNFYQIFSKEKIKYFYLFLGFSHFAFVYITIISKDIGFTISYLLVSSIFAKYTLLNNKFSLIEFLVALMFLFYGTAVKYQAMFILPIFTLWLVYLIRKHYKEKDTSLPRIFSFFSIIMTIILSFIFIEGKDFVDNKLVESNPKNTTYSWQLVKMYDLAGISVATNKLYLPDYSVNHPNFTWDKLRQNFNNDKVDTLAFGPNPTVESTANMELLEELKSHWAQAIIEHPFIYLKNRISLLNTCLKKNYTVISLPNTDGIKGVINKLTAKYVSALRFTSSYNIYFGITFLYCVFGVYYYIKNKNRYALILAFMNCASITLPIILLFFSMASDPRYVYFSMIMTLFSHPFAYKMFQEQKMKSVN